MRNSYVNRMMAAAIIGCSPNRVTALVYAGYLHPVEADWEKFHRWEVEHLAVSNRLCKKRKLGEVQFSLPID